MARWLLLTLVASLIPLFALTAIGSATPTVASHQLRLGQLAASTGCVAQPEDREADATKGCGRGKALMDASAVAVAPDGENVYVASAGSNGVAGFVRDSAGGGLRQNYCISGNGTTGVDGTKGACVDGDALGGAGSVTVSPDGKFVYATSWWSSGIAVLARNVSGALKQVGCVRAVRTCISPRAMNGPRALALTPDGLNAYVAASWSDAVSEFKRDPETGLLSPLGCISDDGNDRVCASGNALRGAAAVLSSPDGKQVYVAAEDSSSVLTFARDPDTGILKQRGCIMHDAPAAGSCTPAKGLEEPSALALTPDGRTLYATAYDSNAVSAFSRNATTGALRWLGCESETVIDEDTGKQVADGCGHARPLENPTGIAVSPDGTRLYVTVESGLTVLDRNRTTGTLTVGGCLSYREYWDDDVVKACQLGIGIADPSGVAVSGDGRNVYVSSWGSDAVSAFAPGPSLSPPRFTAGVLSVRVACPAERVEACDGRIVVTPDAPMRRLARSSPFHVAAGHARVIRLHLSNAVVGALRTRPGMAATVAVTDAARTLAPSGRVFSLQRHRPSTHRTHR